MVPDTNLFLHHPQPFDQLNWRTLVPDRASCGVRVVVPLAVVDELDNLKRSGKEETRMRARLAVRRLLHALGTSPDTRVALGPCDEPGDTPVTTVEVVMDPAGHRRLSDTDSEIVDRALQLGQWGEREVHIVSADGGMLLRASAAGLHAIDWQDFVDD